MKEEILNAISKLQINNTDFEHCLEDNNYTYAYSSYEFESENYLIKLQLCETALWESYDFYETDNLDIELFEVYNQEGLIEFDISDEEILGHLKY